MEQTTRKGFTLAEVLITLGVIGVVAAVTLPTLIKNYQQHRMVNRLKQTYSTLYNAVRMSEAENGPLGTWKFGYVGWNNNTYDYGKTFFDTYLKSYLKVTKYCSKNSKCFGDSYIGTDDPNRTYAVVLANGVIIGFWPRGSFVEIFTDLNGRAGKNAQGKDFFKFILSNSALRDMYGEFNKSGLYFYGQGKSKSILKNSADYGCSKNIKTRYAKTYCGALIMHNNWEIDKDYPW